jgi:hypothetical protein
MNDLAITPHEGNRCRSCLKGARGLAPTGLTIRRFAAVLAAIHIAAFAIMLWSEVDVVAKTTFVLAWGFLNFFWLAVLRRPCKFNHLL